MANECERARFEAFPLPHGNAMASPCHFFQRADEKRGTVPIATNRDHIISPPLLEVFDLPSHRE
jgi:hypothetical protein